MVHFDSGMLHVLCIQPMPGTALGSALRTAVHGKAPSASAQCTPAQHVKYPCIDWCKIIDSRKFLLNFEFYYPKRHFYVSSYNMSISIVGIICSCCDILEEGPEDSPAVWEVIQWVKQQEIPVVAVVISFAGQPSTCWCPSPLQSSWTKWCPLTVRIP